MEGQSSLIPTTSTAGVSGPSMSLSQAHSAPTVTVNNNHNLPPPVVTPSTTVTSTPSVSSLPVTRVLLPGPQQDMSTSLHNSTNDNHINPNGPQISPPLPLNSSPQSLQQPNSNAKYNDNNSTDKNIESQLSPSSSRSTSLPSAPVSIPADENNNSPASITPRNSYPGAVPDLPAAGVSSILKQKTQPALPLSLSSNKEAISIHPLSIDTTLPSVQVKNSGNSNSNNTNSFVSTNPFLNNAIPSSSHSSGNGVNRNHLVRRSSKRKSTGGVSSKIGSSQGIHVTPALTAQLAAAATTATNNTRNNVKTIGDNNNGNIAHGKTKESELKGSDLYSYYSSLGTIGLLPQSTPSGSGHRSEADDDQQNIIQVPPEPGQHGYHPFYGLRKSQSVNNPSSTTGGSDGSANGSKKGFTTRLRKLRHRRGSHESIKSYNSAISGESDSDRSNEGSHNNVELPIRTTSSFTPPKPTPLFLDPTLPPPPPPPIRTNSISNPNKDSSTVSSPITTCTTYSIPFGYGGMGVAPLSIITKNPGAGLPSTSSSGAGSQLTGTSASSTGEPLRESSSTSRFKDILKRNVGLTGTGTSGGNTISSGTSPTAGSTGVLGAPHGGPKFTPLSAGAISEPASGDEQLSLFSVSRMTGRKKKLTKKTSNNDGNSIISGGGGSPLSDEEDMPLSMRGSKHNGSFLPTSRRHRLISHIYRHYHHSGANAGVNVDKEPILSRVASQALKEARDNNHDPNVLLAELEPLPKKFMEEVMGLSSDRPRSTTLTPNSAPTMQSSTSSVAANLMMFPLIPMMVSIIPSSTITSGTGSIQGSVSSAQQQQQQQQMQPQQQQQLAPTSQGNSIATLRSSNVSSLKQFQPHLLNITGAQPLFVHNFLFKLCQNSKFLGYCAFRIHGNQLDFGKLPTTYEQACSQYFREVDISCRFLEKRSKSWKDDRKEALILKKKWLEKYWKRNLRSSVLSPNLQNRHSSSSLPESPTKVTQKIPELEPTTFQNDHDICAGSATNTDGIIRRGSSRTGTRSRSSSVSRLETGSGSTSSFPLPLGMTRDEPTEPQQQQVHADSLRRVLLDRHPLLGNENVMTMSPLMSTNTSQSDIPASNDADQQHSNSPGGRARGYSEPVHPHELVRLLDDEIHRTHTEYIPDFDFYNEMDYLQIDDRILPDWRMHELWEQQQMQWAVDDDYWQKVECQYATEAKAAKYGIELCLEELVKPVDFEKFDPIDQVEILNENRDSTIFSIANSSRTNVMWLESPSLKLKHEFLNLIAIVLIDHGEPDLQEEAWRETAMDIMLKPGLKDLQGHLDMNPEKYERRRHINDNEVLHELLDIRICHLEEQLREKRDETMETMKGLEEVSARLDNLDDIAKKLSASLLRAMETHEVENALQPSLTTGLTLAQTVDLKIKDVNERIVVCGRIMAAARLNLNRLKYEIELEQRSIRLFRQYKIAISIVSFLVLLLLWMIYYTRRLDTPSGADAALAQSTPGFTSWSPSFFEREEPQKWQQQQQEQYE
ncbi:hypothetical protein FBU30_001771 [Linnemannia zychae]|nr:hypothetical protein FBU30_001771 [Linnemannia zychae]